MDISVAFLIVGFCFVVLGVALWSIPAALVLGGAMLLAVGVLLVKRGEDA